MRASRLLGTLLLAAVANAQTTAIVPGAPMPEPNGIVIGRVFCGDTGRPARFATVSLKPVPTSTKSASTPANSSAVSVTVDTSIDGTFTLDHVAPGRYYVIVRKEGYIEPSGMFTAEQLSDPSQPVRALVQQVLREVVVESDSTARVDIQIQRGATLSGTVTYDDGTPANRINVKVLRRNEKGRWSTPNYVGFYVGSTATTDDRGHYRIVSLLPDSYLIVATLNLTSMRNVSNKRESPFYVQSIQSTLSFYGDGKFHMEDATPVTVRGDEERTGTDIVISLNKLHKLSGRVAIEPGNHFVNAASIDLLYGDEKTVIAHDTIRREDGLFHFEFIPEGDYILRVTNARDVTWDPPDPRASPTSFLPIPPPDKERVLETYGNVDMPLILRGDMTGITATVPAKQSNPTAASN